MVRLPSLFAALSVLCILTLSPTTQAACGAPCDSCFDDNPGNCGSDITDSDCYSSGDHSSDDYFCTDCASTQFVRIQTATTNVDTWRPARDCGGTTTTTVRWQGGGVFTLNVASQISFYNGVSHQVRRGVLNGGDDSWYFEDGTEVREYSSTHSQAFTFACTRVARDCDMNVQGGELRPGSNAGTEFVDFEGFIVVYNTGVMNIVNNIKLINSPIFVSVGGAVTKTSTGTVTQSGTNQVNYMDGGTLSIEGAWTGGDWNCDGGTINLSGGAVNCDFTLDATTVNLSGTYAGSGSYTVDGTGVSISASSGTPALSGKLTMAQGSLTVNGGDLSLSGGLFSSSTATLAVSSGSLSLGSSTISATSFTNTGGDVSFTAGSTTSTAYTQSAGSLSVSAGAAEFSSGITINGGTTTVTGGTLALTGGSTIGGTSFTNTGGDVSFGATSTTNIAYSQTGGSSALIVTSGTATFNSGIAISNGDVQVSSGATLSLGGSSSIDGLLLEGSGTISGDFGTSATIRPNDDDSSDFSTGVLTQSAGTASLNSGAEISLYIDGAQTSNVVFNNLVLNEDINIAVRFDTSNTDLFNGDDSYVLVSWTGSYTPNGNFFSVSLEDGALSLCSTAELNVDVGAKTVTLRLDCTDYCADLETACAPYVDTDICQGVQGGESCTNGFGSASSCDNFGVANAGTTCASGGECDDVGNCEVCYNAGSSGRCDADEVCKPGPGAVVSECVDCLLPEHCTNIPTGPCPGTPVCETDNTCTYPFADPETACTGGVCGDVGQCGECWTETQCSFGETCDQPSQTCITCTGDGDCTSPGSPCETTAGTCNNGFCEYPVIDEHSPCRGQAGFCTAGSVGNPGSCVECTFSDQATAQCDSPAECELASSGYCSGNSCSYPSPGVARGTVCTSGGNYCDGDGGCVECVTNQQCIDADGDRCNGLETCDVNGDCQDEADVNCAVDDPAVGSECQANSGSSCVSDSATEFHCTWDPLEDDVTACTTGTSGDLSAPDNTGVCSTGGACVDCVDDGGCASAGTSCNTTSNICVECYSDAECDDTEFCNGVEECVNFYCISGSPDVCSAGQTCSESKGGECITPENDDAGSLALLGVGIGAGALLLVGVAVVARRGSSASDASKPLVKSSSSSSPTSVASKAKGGASSDQDKFEELLLKHPELVDAMVATASSPKEKGALAKLLVSELDFNKAMFPFIERTIQSHVDGCADESALFRTTSFVSHALSAYAHLVGRDYLVKIVGAPLKAHVLNKGKVDKGGSRQSRMLDLDPSRMSTFSSLEAATQELLTDVETVILSVLDHPKDLPTQISTTAAILKKSVEVRFDQSVAVNAVAQFLMLRFISPAISLPHKHGISDNPPGENTQRTLILLTKIVQGLANNVELGGKEEYMGAAEEFRLAFRPLLEQFLEDQAFSKPNVKKAGAKTVVTPSDHEDVIYQLWEIAQSNCNAIHTSLREQDALAVKRAFGKLCKDTNSEKEEKKDDDEQSVVTNVTRSTANSSASRSRGRGGRGGRGRGGGRGGRRPSRSPTRRGSEGRKGGEGGRRPSRSPTRKGTEEGSKRGARRGGRGGRGGRGDGGGGGGRGGAVRRGTDPGPGRGGKGGAANGRSNSLGRRDRSKSASRRVGFKGAK